jgi:hypothetical protein
MSQTPVTIESTTDSKEAVDSALGKKVEKPAPEKVAESAAAKKPAKTLEASEAQEKEESHESEETDAHAEDSEESDETLEAAPKKKKGGFQKRIDKLSKRAQEAEREKEYWKQEALKGKAPGEQKVEPKKEADTSKKPKAEDFEKHEEFIEAMADWKAEQKLADREAKQREAQVKSEGQKKRDEHFKRYEEFKAKHEDFEETLEDIKGIQVSMTVNNAIIESEFGPALMYEFAKNPDELKRISALDPIAAAKAIGKIEARIEKDSSLEKEEKVEAKPETTKAPKPIKPVGGKASVIKTIRDDLPYDEWVAVRRKEIREANGR